MEQEIALDPEANLDCIFCKIIGAEITTEFIAENEHAVAFKDLYPQAPVHVLVVPKKHSANIAELTTPAELEGLFDLIRSVASEYTDGEFKLQFNAGSREGQTVFHTHAHVLSQQTQ